MDDKGLVSKITKEQAIYNALSSSFYQRFGALSASGIIIRAVELFGNNEAIKTTQGTVLTYKQLYQHALQISLQLHTQGIRPGNIVMLFIENSIEFYLAYWATLLSGAIVVPVNTFLHANEITYIINDARPSLIIVSERLKSIIALLTLDESIKILLDKELAAYDNTFDTTSIIPHEIKGNNPALILYTSGTTGQPKGVVLSAENMVTNSMQAAARLQLLTNEQECFFAVLPLFHAFAQNTCIWLPALTGSSVIIVNKIERSTIIDGLRLKPTIFFGFPALYGLLCLMKTANLNSIKLFVSGADAMPDKIRAAFALLYGRKILSGYGLTEASPVISIHHFNDDRQTNNVGKPLVGISVEIRDDQGNVLKQNEIGTLWIKGQNIMLGYYKTEEATNEILQKGWLCTGDLASINHSEEIIIHGRNKDLIIHKGFNIYPQEVENVLLKSSLVMRAAVIGRSDEATGQIPIAYIMLKVAKKEAELELRQLCKNHLAAYKIPRTFIFKDELPLSPTGKIDKKQLHHGT